MPPQRLLQMRGFSRSPPTTAGFLTITSAGFQRSLSLVFTVSVTPGSDHRISDRRLPSGLPAGNQPARSRDRPGSRAGQAVCPALGVRERRRRAEDSPAGRRRRPPLLHPRRRSAGDLGSPHPPLRRPNLDVPGCTHHRGHWRPRSDLLHPDPAHHPSEPSLGAAPQQPSRPLSGCHRRAHAAAGAGPSARSQLPTLGEKSSLPLPGHTPAPRSTCPPHPSPYDRTCHRQSLSN